MLDDDPRPFNFAIRNFKISKFVVYDQKLPEDRMEKSDEEQDLFFHQHFWPVSWTNLLYAHHYLPVSRGNL
jgi:hypothetical protein